MKTIKTIGGQLCICTSVSLSQKINELELKPFTVKVEEILQAVTMRMQHCMAELEENTAKDLIIDHVVLHTNDEEEVSIVRYVNGGNFSQLSYTAMEQILKTFTELSRRASTVDVRFLQALSVLQLNQIKKALAALYGTWNNTCSFIEEIEMCKISQRMQG